MSLMAVGDSAWVKNQTRGELWVGKVAAGMGGGLELEDVGFCSAILTHKQWYIIGEHAFTTSEVWSSTQDLENDVDIVAVARGCELKVTCTRLMVAGSNLGARAPAKLPQIERFLVFL